MAGSREAGRASSTITSAACPTDYVADHGEGGERHDNPHDASQNRVVPSVCRRKGVDDEADDSDNCGGEHGFRCEERGEATPQSLWLERTRFGRRGVAAVDTDEHRPRVLPRPDGVAFRDDVAQSGCVPPGLARSLNLDTRCVFAQLEPCRGRDGGSGVERVGPRGILACRAPWVVSGADEGSPVCRGRFADLNWTTQLDDERTANRVPVGRRRGHGLPSP